MSGGLDVLEVLISKNVEVTSNNVIAHRIPEVWSGGIYLWKTHGCKVRANKISGSAVYGLHMVESTGNMFADNNLSQFTPQLLLPSLPLAHIAFFFGADINTVLGGRMSSTNVNYLELEARGNVVKGYGVSAGELDQEQGKAVAQAMQQMRWSGEE